ncbi:proline-rich protein 35 isoform X2 [Erythrolamprus reginae]|uniref:proline-rich protein 35 isoform X2 n=1 Tax=Erythrolamprus reginae TaxID=121349 RepID=UPI00396C418C
MSKDEAGCKLAPVYKHKERKPKKPHYIPRPWGKPYNYKCFQCPFTCMEKSHLYNHMKYSLCKNSLSLLIESDWPYKKGGLLHPELRLLQAAETSQICGRQEESKTYETMVMEGTHSKYDDRDRDGGEGKTTEDTASSERMSDETSQFQEEEEEEEEDEEEEEELSRFLQEVDTAEKKEVVKGTLSTGETTEPDMNTLLFQLKNKQDKASKDPAPDFIITDVFSLKKHVAKGKEIPSVELDPKPKHCKMPSKCPGSGGVFMEQWKLLANGQRRSTTGVLTPCADGNVIPCYPPPAYGDFHESQGLNFSLLGINYPLAPNLFSYFSPSVTSGATSHSHLAQFPFLASTAQLMHPHSGHFQSLQNPERSTFLPRFYYPLLFEHSFNSAENKVAAAKPDAQQLPPAAIPAPLQPQTSTDPSKGGVLKVPVLKTSLPWPKGFREEPPPEQGHKRLLLQEEDKKWLIHERESYSLLAAGHVCKKPSPEAFQGLMGIKEGAAVLPNILKKTEPHGAACLDNGRVTASNLKRKFAKSGLDLASPEMTIPEKEIYPPSALQVTPMQASKSMDHWQVELHDDLSEGQHKTESSEIITASDQPLLKPSNDQVTTVGPRDQEMTTVFIGDLSKTLEEYQEVEKKLSHLANKDSPAQKQLRDQLVKIRQELFNIHQALEKTNKFSEGPLDLSMKRSSAHPEKGHQGKKESKVGIQGDKVQGKDLGSTNKSLEVGEADLEKVSDCFLDAQNKTIDLLIQMSHSKNIQNPSSETHLGAVIKAEVVPLNVPLEFRHVMEPYYSHTTKCEADSSVPLCTDGRSSGNQAPPLSMAEENPLGCRAIPCSLSCNLTSETGEV